MIDVALSQTQIKDVEDTLKTSLRGKFNNYNPEPALMPFHARLLGKDRLALFKFIQSLNTGFGTTIYEPVALALAKENFKSATAQAVAGNQISVKAQAEIQKIMDRLTAADATPNKSEEIERVRAVANSGKMAKVKPTKVDLMFESKSGEYFLCDIKTVKPNIGNFKEFKRTLLEWAAVMLVGAPDAKVNTFVAIPYNPYAPKPYNRWTIRGMLDLQSELKVAEEFWDFLGGENTYDDLLDCFERVGVELRDEIDRYFKRRFDK